VSPAIDRLGDDVLDKDVLVESDHEIRLLSPDKAVFALDGCVGEPGVALSYVLLAKIWLFVVFF